MDYSIGDFFSSVIKLFALLTPPAALSAFLSGTQTYGGRRKRRTALRTGTAVFIVGTVLYFFGESLFSVFGFTLAACMGLNLIAASIVGGFFAVINYRIKILALQKAAPAAASAAAAEFDDDEEEI